MTWRPGDVKATGGIITTSGTRVEVAPAPPQPDRNPMPRFSLRRWLHG